MAATDLQQPENISKITGPLGDFVEFKNGRSSPDRTDSGVFAVYGSNGEIGKADVTNAPEGTLVVGRVGSYCGSVHYSPNKCWVTDNAIIGSSRSQKDSRFWFYKLASLGLNNYRAGSGQPLLNQQILNSIQVSIPANEDDRFQIAKKLAAFDDKIDLNHRINQTLEAMAQAIFKSWFVDFDPVKAKIAAKQQGRDPLRAAMSAISGKPEADLDALPPEQYEQLAATAALFSDEMEASELGEIPKGWSVGAFKDCCVRVESGGTPSRKEPAFWGGSIPWLTSGEVRDVVVLDTKEKITRAGLDASSAKLWPGMSTVVAMYGATAGQVCLIANEMTANQACCALIPKAEFRTFIFIAARQSVQQLAEKASGSAQQNLNKSLVENHVHVIPDAGVAEIFELRTTSLLQKWVLNQREIAALGQHRGTLLPKLLSGELSVVDVTSEVST